MNAPLKLTEVDLARTSSGVTLSVFSNPTGKPVGKSYKLIDGKPTKQAGTFPFAERCDTRTLNGPKELADLVTGMTGAEHLCSGIPCNGSTSTKIKTSSQKKQLAGAITRSMKEFVFPSGPGIVLLDHDFRDETPSRLHLGLEDFDWALASVLSWSIRDTASVSYPSSSSYIECSDGSANRGLRGHHTLLIVADASDWKRALDCIHKRMVIAGFGWVLIGASGVRMVRSIVDDSVGGQPNRAIYSGKASLGEGLRYSADRVVTYASGDVFDIRVSVPDLTLDELLAFDREKERLLAETEDQAAAVKAKDKAAKVASMVKNGASKVVAEFTYEKAGVGELYPDHEIMLANGEVITVRDILESPEAYNDRYCMDPIEPNYGEWRPVAKIYTDQDVPIISSFAHGGNGQGGVKKYILKTNPVDDFLNYDLEHPMQVDDDPNVPTVVPKQPAMRFKILSGAEVANSPPMRWTVRSVIPQTGLGVLYGPSGSGKSFLILDLAAAVAGGADKWYGHRVTQCPVVYCAFEGEAGIGKRLAAWSKQHDRLIPDSLKFVTQPFNLLNDSDVSDLSKAIRVSGGSGGVVILDTLNRAAPGADENSSVDMGKIIAAAQKLQTNIGGMVLLVHHCGKDAKKGMRGHSSLNAALDSVIEVDKNGEDCEWSVFKSKDDVTGKSYPFGLKVVQLGFDDDFEMTTSCVALPDSNRSGQSKIKLPTTGNQKLAYDALKDAFMSSANYEKAGAPDACPCLRYDQAVEIVRNKLPVDSGHAKSRAVEAVKGLVTRGVYGFAGDWLWRSHVIQK